MPKGASGTQGEPGLALWVETYSRRPSPGASGLGLVLCKMRVPVLSPVPGTLGNEADAAALIKLTGRGGPPRSAGPRHCPAGTALTRATVKCCVSGTVPASENWKTHGPVLSGLAEGREGRCCPDLRAERGADGVRRAAEDGLLELSFDEGRSFLAQKAAGTAACSMTLQDCRGTGRPGCRGRFPPGSWGSAEGQYQVWSEEPSAAG